MRRIDGKALAAGLVAALAVSLAGPAAADLRLPPPGYTFVPAPGCDRPSRQPKLYDDCADQMALFLRARAEAYGAKKQLLVVFGANWCPSCRSLKAAITSPAVVDRPFKGVALKDRLHVLELAVSVLHQGRVVGVPSGQAVLDAVLAVRPDVKQRSIPFIAGIDPVTGKISARNLDDLDGPTGWLHDGVATVIAAADEESRGGAPAPREPGWLKRKWLRWFGY
jgi:thiol-disulfide isomerase/thioredoxin